MHGNPFMSRIFELQMILIVRDFSIRLGILKSALLTKHFYDLLYSPVTQH